MSHLHSIDSLPITLYRSECGADLAAGLNQDTHWEAGGVPDHQHRPAAPSWPSLRSSHSMRCTGVTAALLYNLRRQNQAPEGLMPKIHLGIIVHEIPSKVLEKLIFG